MEITRHEKTEMFFRLTLPNDDGTKQTKHSQTRGAAAAADVKVQVKRIGM